MKRYCHETNSKSSSTYAPFNVNDEAEAREIFDPLLEQFQEIKGIKEEIGYGNKSLTEMLSIDSKKAELVEFNNLLLM